MAEGAGLWGRGYRALRAARSQRSRSWMRFCRSGCRWPPSSSPRPCPPPRCRTPRASRPACKDISSLKDTQILNKPDPQHHDHKLEVLLGRLLTGSTPLKGHCDQLSCPKSPLLLQQESPYVSAPPAAGVALRLLPSPGGFLCADEELGPVGVGPGVGHGQGSRGKMLQGEVLISKLVAINGLSTGSVVVGEVPALRAQHTR